MLLFPSHLVCKHANFISKIIAGVKILLANPSTLRPEELAKTIRGRGRLKSPPPFSFTD